MWDGPKLAQFVVSVGAPVVDHHFCESYPEGWTTERPGVADTVPDLDSNAVGGQVLAALPVGWSCTSERDGTFAVRPAFGVRSEGATFAEAASLAFVAAR